MDIKQAYQKTSFILFLIFIFLQSCAPVEVKPPSRPPFTDQEIADILLALRDQENAVHSFFSIGRMEFEGEKSELEANVLIVGTRDPLRIKVEITHFWGRPLFHIIIDEKNIHIISFPEKRYYTGHIEESIASNLLPVRLDTNQIWALGRGFPILCNYTQVESLEMDRIRLLNRKRHTLQVIDFYPESHNPSQNLISDQGLKVEFFDFENDNNIRFARETRLSDQDAGTTLEVNIKQMVFNRAFDQSIFDLSIPADFKLYTNPPRLDTQ